MNWDGDPLSGGQQHCQSICRRSGQLLRSTFGGHFKALGDMHNCSDFLKNIYSVVNDVQNATELVVVPSTMRNRFSLSWDTDPG